MDAFWFCSPGQMTHFWIHTCAGACLWEPCQWWTGIISLIKFGWKPSWYLLSWDSDHMLVTLLTSHWRHPRLEHPEPKWWSPSWCNLTLIDWCWCFIILRYGLNWLIFDTSKKLTQTCENPLNDWIAHSMIHGLIFVYRFYNRSFMCGRFSHMTLALTPARWGTNPSTIGRCQVSHLANVVAHVNPGPSSC